MNILVTGYTGQLGYDVVTQGMQQGHHMIGIGTKQLDITNKEAVSLYVKNVKPDAIIHCAAYTNVDKAEDDRNICESVNVDGTNNLAQVAKQIGSKFIYISTDYVFNGKGESPFKEEDEANPIGHYGKTKLAGEEVVKKTLDEYFILRISWVFGVNGNNFVKTMLRLSENHDELNIVGDQVGSPTYTLDLAKLIMEIVVSDKYGVYHASNDGFCSWADFAKEIFRQANIKVKVNSITTEDYPTKAARPRNSRMSKQKLVESGFSPLPIWQDAVDRYLKQLTHEVK